MPALDLLLLFIASLSPTIQSTMGGKLGDILSMLYDNIRGGEIESLTPFDTS